jgi:hypothetical protein
MKLKEYLANIAKMVEENEDILEYDVVYARDDEGNGFQEIHYTPTLGYQDEDVEFIQEENYDDEEHEGGSNSICVN